jgi:hypothetical protein
MKRAALWAVLIGFAGCASHTLINSTPPGAEVLVDGRVVGVTPAVFKETSTWNWSGHLLTLRRPGYATLTTQIAASQVDVGRLVVGVLLAWPLLLATTDYPEKYEFPLTPLPASSDARTVDASPEAPPQPASSPGM